jgi:hypothetical protein
MGTRPTSCLKSHASRIRSVFGIAIVALVLPLLPNSATGLMSTSAKNQIGRYLFRYDRIFMNPVDVTRQVRATGTFTLPTADGVFDIVLIPHDVRATSYRAEKTTADGSIQPVVPEDLHTYRGTVPGLPGVEARFSIREESVEGILLTPGQWYFVEPMRNYSSASEASEMVVYRASDIRPDAIGTCGTSLPERIGRVEELFEPPTLNGTISTADIATEADYEYVTAMGGAAGANNAILDVLNQVDGIYRTQLSISLHVVYQHAWETADDPYSSTAASTMLGEFRNYWATHFDAVNFDLAHMWTGKDMDGSTIGIAYIGVVCNARTYSYGVSQRFNSAPGKYILTAHEIGHNFGASHPDQATPPQTTCSNTIMNSSVGTGTTFCQFSKDEVAMHVSQSSSCLTADSGSRCDINGDTGVNILDIQSLINSLLGTGACPGNCDINKDGTVNVLDLQWLVNVVLRTATCP